MKHPSIKLPIQKLLILLLIITSMNDSYAQTGDLYTTLSKSDFNIKNTRSSLDLLSYNLNRSTKTKKQKARNLQANAQQVANRSHTAYLQAKQIVNKLKADKNYKLADKVEQLKGDLYNLNYAANALVKYCQWMINKPKTHGVRTFKSMVSAFNTIIEHKNASSKNKKILLDVVSWEAYKNMKRSEE